MYISHIELERRERNRELMHAAARERLIHEAVDGRKGAAGHADAPARPAAWLLANAAAVASLLIACLGQPAWPKGH